MMELHILMPCACLQIGFITQCVDSLNRLGNEKSMVLMRHV